MQFPVCVFHSSSAASWFAPLPLILFDLPVTEDPISSAFLLIIVSVFPPLDNEILWAADPHSERILRGVWRAARLPERIHAEGERQLLLTAKAGFFALIGWFLPASPRFARESCVCFPSTRWEWCPERLRRWPPALRCVTSSIHSSCVLRFSVCRVLVFVVNLKNKIKNYINNKLNEIK